MLLINDIKNINKIVKKENFLLGSEEVFCYSEDATNCEGHLVAPDAVVFVESIEQVQKILSYANKRKIPVVSRGAGTNMVGACTCPKGGIVLNFSKMNKILDLNPIDMTITVQPGTIINDIKDAAAAQGLFYPPDPSNFKVSTIGGSIAQSSGGALGFKYGTTKDYILSLKVVLSNGTLMTLGAGTIKDAVGYHLNQLIVGSEGTLAIVVEATLKLIPKPETTRTVLAYFDSISDLTNSVNSILRHKFYPSTIDFMDNNAISTVEKFYPSGLRTDKLAMLLINLDGYEASIDYQQNSIVSIIKDSNASCIEIARTSDEIDRVWTARRSSFAATAKLAPDVLSDDLVVPRSKIIELLEGTANICKKYKLQVCIVGHLGDGNIHPQIALNKENSEELERYFSARNEIYNLVLSLGGTISAEHGIGAEKIDYIEKCVGNRPIYYMKKIKDLLDPNCILNPDKIFKM